MKRKIALGLVALVLPLLGWAQPAPGQPAGGWKLKDCLDYGLKNYGTVRIAQNQTQIAAQQAREAVAGYLPQVTAQGTVDDNIKLQTTVLPAGIFGPEPTRVAFGTKYQTTASASLDQTLYDKSLLIGIKAARPNAQKAELNTRQTREDVIYAISSNYYQVFVAEQQIALLKDNIARTEQVLNILKLQRDNGVIQPVDYNRTEVSYNSAKSQLALAESNLSLALNRLKFQMGMPQNQALALSDTTLTTQVPTVNTGTFDARSLTDFQLSETNLTLQKLDRERIKAGYLPKLSATARYGTLALGNNYAKSLEKFSGFGSIGLRVSVPIFDGFRRDAQIRQSTLNIQSLQEQQKLNVASYQLQYNNAQTQLQRAQSSLQNDERNVKLAQQVYDVTTLQYKQGTKPLTDLVNAENSYRQAQNDYINSLLNYNQARLDLEQSQGTLLNFYNQL
ncbi:TolC family protein [Spirosoma taeanense]|uniref:TolC family protein n=1 Tax=Spirosoma taeanense TaxID=2735870 RepID=A0A6M5YAP9_9BACT|nr:TolC family protein [Spirosoma taeanense]QJW90360.1 TolC family protein [Spirosoma taeanense]